MKKEKSVALFDHQGCQTKFFARLEREHSRFSLYKGKCPNPSCNRSITLYPEATFSSMDKARREYIKLKNFLKGKIFWQT